MIMLVSIIIPSYNVEEYVAECLESAIAQTYRPIEIIAVDNNSTDNTLAILRDYERRYPDLITVLEEKKQGAPAARNKGISIAKGEWLQFLDADDLLLPEKLTNQICLLQNNSECCMVIGAYWFKQLSGETNPVKIDNVTDPFKLIATCRLGYTCSNLFRSEEVKMIGGWDQDMKGEQDTDLIFRILTIKNAGDILYDKNAMTIYRMRKNGQITSNCISINKCGLYLRIRMFEYFRENMPEYFLVSKRYYQDIIYHYISRYAIYDRFSAKKFLNNSYLVDYQPRYRKGIISIQNVLGYYLIGLENYFILRNFIKGLSKSLSFFNPNCNKKLT